METRKMKIEYRKQIDSETAPWQPLTNIDELLWNGVYALRVTDDDGSHNLPFRFGNDDTVTLVVKDHAHEGMLENGRTIVQTITRVDRTTGNVFVYTRTRYNAGGTPNWNYWALATEGEAVIDMPKATSSSLGAVIVGNGLVIDADGKVSVAPASITEENLQSALKDKITEAASKARTIDFFVQNEGLALHYGALLQNDVPYTGTDLRVHTDKILASGERLVVNEDYVISTLKIFEGEQEIAYLNNLNEKEYSLDGTGMHYQFEFRKFNAKPFINDELAQVVKAYHRRPIVWSSAHHIDHFVAAGTYCITGERTNIADGLPITNAASGHSINARLVVLDSSIPGSGKEGDKCITQVLTISNRVGADSNIYMRTGLAADTATLIAGNGWGAWGKLLRDLDAVTTERIQDGSVTAQKLASEVLEKVENPLRALFVAAGAEYNDTGADKTMTAPWGETVTHKAGHYYLNGLGDITEKQMVAIYNFKNWELLAKSRRGLQQAKLPRTLITSFDAMQNAEFWNDYKVELNFYSNGLIEVLPYGPFTRTTTIPQLPLSNNTTATSLKYFGGQCPALKAVGAFSVKYVTNFGTGSEAAFYNCAKLEYADLFNLSASITLEWSPLFSKVSLLYMINNATPSSAITITLHPDAYARLADDAEIVTALEAQPLISLVSA